MERLLVFFSVAGFEMILQRHVSHYLITYYLPSGTLYIIVCAVVHLSNTVSDVAVPYCLGRFSCTSVLYTENSTYIRNAYVEENWFVHFFFGIGSFLCLSVVKMQICGAVIDL
jgi:hypothetical protein